MKSNKNQLPSSWLIVKLSEITSIQMGQAPEGKTYNNSRNGIPFIAGAGDLGKLYPKAKRWTTSPTSLTKEGDIIICIRATIGELNFADKKYCLGRGVAGIRVNELIVDKIFLYHWLKLNRQLLINKGTGTTFLQIKKSDLEKTLVYLPPISEQKAVVEILKQGETLLELRNISNEKLKKLKSDLFYDFFLKDQDALNSWKKIPLEKMAVKITSGSRGWSKYYSDNGARFIRVKDISNGEINSDKPQMITPPDTAARERSLILPKDILISIVGSVGKIALFPNDIGEAYVSQNVSIIRMNKDYSSLFTSLYLDHKLGGRKDILRLIYGQTQPTIGLNHLEKIRIPAAPSNLIEKFEAAYNEYLKIYNNARNSLNRINNLIENLKIKVFSGELTDSFRKKQESVLSSEVKLREETLKIKLVYEPSKQIEDAIELPKNINSYLSKIQQVLLDSMEIAEGYVLAENDFNKLKIPPNQIQRNLDLLTEIGLIKSVNIAIAPGEIGNVFYTPAYRSLNENDNTKEADLESLEKETII